MTQSWWDWRQAVLTVIREDLHEVLADVGEDDVDWEAWRPLYEQGCSPRDAVAHALLREPS